LFRIAAPDISSIADTRRIGMSYQTGDLAAAPAPDVRIALYLDIDGVLLRRTRQQGFGAMSLYEVASGATELLEWATANFDVFWLSTRTSGGSIENAERAFRHASPSAMRSDRFSSLIRSIPASQWDTAKISGIDTAKPFFWIDEDPDPISVAHLSENDLMHRLIKVSVDREPDLLNSLPGVITERMKSR
jgi:hypothetical protein